MDNKSVNADLMPKKSSTSSSRNANEQGSKRQATSNKSSNINQNNVNKNSKKKPLTKKQKRRRRRRRLFIAEAILLVVLIVLAVIYAIYSKIAGEVIDFSDLGINSELDTELLKGYTNIALFGLDNRSSDNYDTGNSDVIMVASINNDTQEVRLVSVYRDTYWSVGDGEYRKANYAYAHGGVSEAVAMLNTNLDLDIEDYVTVDWAAMVEIIDELGGVDIDITEEEAYNINLCTVEIDQVTGKSTAQVTGSGVTHLDGTQATAYARIRALAGDDFMRASRQRIVLQAMMDKIKEADVATLTSIASDCLDDVKTSLSLAEIVALATHVKEYTIAGTTGFPSSLTTGTTDAGSSVIPVELDNNVVTLHEYFFNDTDYTVSNTVQKISDNIASYTGITEDNTDIYNLDTYLETADPGWEEETETTEDTE